LGTGSFQIGLGGSGDWKSHVNVAFALVPLKRLNSVKVCDKMLFKFSSFIFWGSEKGEAIGGGHVVCGMFGT